MPRRITLSLYTLALMLAVVTVVASGFGALRLPLSLLWHDGDDALRQIWFNIRLPRVLLALVIGGSLALSGCVMQGLFRNPLADPGLLGISSGAALAVALWVVLPLTLPPLIMLYAPMLAAFIGALIATVVTCSADSGTVRSPGCCWSASPLMRYVARRWACCRGSAMTPSYASSRYGEWAALARRSGQRCWRSPL